MPQAAPWRDPWEALLPPPPARDEAVDRKRPPTARVTEERPFPTPAMDWREWPVPEMPPTLPRYPTEMREAYSRWEEEAFQRQEVSPWEQQMRDWELARRGYYYDSYTGRVETGQPIYTPLPEAPFGAELPPEWAEWYGRATTPELRPEGNVEYYQRQYEGVPAVALPEDEARMTDEERLAWFNANAYETVYTDQQGNIISAEEVLRRATVSPDEPIRQVWFMGGGETRESEFEARDVEFMESIRAPAGALERRGEVVGGRWFGEPTTAARGQALMRAQEKEAVAATLESSLVKSVLASEWSYEEKLSTLTDLYSQYTGKALDTRGLAELRSAAFESLTPEEKEAMLGREEYVPPREEVPAEKPVSEAALTEALAPFGVNLIANYPFISPVTQAHLTRIPSETLQLMARYLEEKGVPWGDFIAVSGGLYGGGAPARGRWEIPRQWG